MTQEQKIIDCIANALEITSDDAVTLGEEELLSEHGMDSITFIQMIVLLEEALEIEILDSDLLIENFSSKKKILETLQKYLEQ